MSMSNERLRQIADTKAKPEHADLPVIAQELLDLRQFLPQHDCRFTGNNVADFSGSHCPLSKQCTRCERDWAVGRVEELSNDLLAMEHDRDRLQQTVVEQATSLVQSDEDFRKLHTECDRLRDYKDVAEAQIAKLRESEDRLRAELAEANRVLDANNKTIAKWSENWDALRAELAEAKKQRDAERIALNLERGVIRNLREELAEAKKQRDTDLATVALAERQEPSDAYDKVDRFLRNNLDDEAYAEHSAALDALAGHAPPQPAPSDAEIEVWHANLTSALLIAGVHESDPLWEMIDDEARALMRRARPDDELARAAEAMLANVGQTSYRDTLAVRAVDLQRLREASFAARKEASR